MWDYATALTNSYSNSNIRLSLGFKQGLSHSFTGSIDRNNWQNILGYNSKNSQSQAFAAEYTGVLVAPYTGIYTFYANGDDALTVRGALYDPLLGVYGPETSLINVPSYTAAGDFITYASINHSPGISLTRGSRYRLRTSLINKNTLDYIGVAMRVDPAYDPNTGYLLDGVLSANGQDINLAPETISQPVPLTFSPTFLHHHAVREIQLVSINAILKREVQVNIVLVVGFPIFLFIIEFIIRRSQFGASNRERST